MYAKLFSSIYQGTLRGNSRGLLVFTNLLAHADSAGMVDIHPRAIADEVGLTVDQVKDALLELEASDEESRSPEEGGRRIVRMDGHRAWGWRIVNYAKYRAIRSEEDRREQNRLAQERWRSKQNKQSQPPSATISHDQPRSAQAEAEAEAEVREKTSSSLCVAKAPRATKRCPKDFEPSAALIESLQAECPAVDLSREFLKFKDYTFGTARADWEATFRNWIRTASERVRSSPTKSFRERDDAAAAERIAQFAPSLAARKPPPTFEVEAIDVTPRALGK